MYTNMRIAYLVAPVRGRTNALVPRVIYASVEPDNAANWQGGQTT